jgi:tetratricopeptide (TPR) repeat protein
MNTLRIARKAAAFSAFTLAALTLPAAAVAASSSRLAAAKPPVRLDRLAQTPAEPELPRGRIVEKVVCKDSPGQAYALYLPTGYTPERRWPILYAFDDRWHGKEVAELFQRAAESYGWIVVSSWNTASDGPLEPNVAASRALWADTHARFRLDDGRVYVAGLSGTVRLSCLLALAAPGTVSGVIGASAGYPVGVEPKQGDPITFFGTYGDRDFNYYEVRNLDGKLAAAGLAHRVEPFAGGHQWPPEELAAHAVGWMEMQAMKAGRRAKAPAVVETLWQADEARAREAAAAGRLEDARHTWEAMAADYAGLRDTAPAVQAAAALAASDAYRQELRARAVRDQRDRLLLARAPEILGRIAPGHDPISVKEMAAALRIAELRERAASADPEERRAADRVLNTYLVQATFYLPRDYVEKKQYDRALFLLTLATEITPREPELWLDIAAVHARRGKEGREAALAALRKAVSLGLDTPARLEDPSFASLRTDDGYRQLLARAATPEPEEPPTEQVGAEAVQIVN